MEEVEKKGGDIKFKLEPANGTDMAGHKEYTATLDGLMEAEAGRAMRARYEARVFFNNCLIGMAEGRGTFDMQEFVRYVIQQHKNKERQIGHANYIVELKK